MLSTLKKRKSFIELADKLISQIQFEIEQIDHLFDAYQALFLHALQSIEPTLVEITALGSVLHSFYNGLENIFVRIAKALDKNVPSDAQWHRELLLQMGESNPNRMPVLSSSVILRLNDYRSFRHFYRHSYSFFLEWDELEQLVKPLSALWTQVKIELQAFIDSLRNDKV